MKISDVNYFYDDWHSLKEEIHILQMSSEYIWRGHSSSKWKLSSSLYRFFEHEKINPNKRADIETNAVTFFNNNLNKNKNAFDLYEIKEYSFNDLLVIAYTVFFIILGFILFIISSVMHCLILNL